MDESQSEVTPQSIKDRIKKERRGPVTERGWSGYPSAFLLDRDYTKEDWEGKSILDVGCGTKWSYPDSTFPGATVCAIDPEIDGRIKVVSAHEKRKGIAQEIPYDDNKFDLVLSSHAVPQHVYPVDMPAAILDMIRVMKPGGEIRMVPCVERDLNRFKGFLIESGFEVSPIEGGPDGSVFQIKSGADIVGSVELKNTAWRQFRELLVDNGLLN